MSLFPSANDFKSGPGVEKDAPRKTGVGRFFELVGRDMSGMFLANLLTCLGFLPVICLVYIGFLMNSLPVMVLSAAVGGILAGPVLAGMYDTVLRALRDEAGYWWTTYRKAFRQNFKASILPGMLYCVVVTVQVFLVYFCFNMLYHGTNVGVGMWVATVLNLILFHMLFSYLWPQIVLLDQPLGQTLKNSVNCMIAFLPHALAASLVTVLFWGLVILCMPLGLLLMLVFGVIGYLLKLYKYNVVPIVLGLILGPIAEAGLSQALLLNNNSISAVFTSMVTRPICIVLFLCMVISVSYPYISQYRAKKKSQTS